MTTELLVAEMAMRCASKRQPRARRARQHQHAGGDGCSSDDDIPEVLLMMGPLLVDGEDVLLRSPI